MSQHNEIVQNPAQTGLSSADASPSGLPSPATGSAPDPGAILAALLRRWKMATFAGLLAGTSAAVLVYFFAPQAKYKSQAMLQVSTNQPRIIIDTNEVRPDFKTYQKTQETLLKSRLVLGAALSRPEIKNLPVVLKQVDPIEWLDKELKVEFTGGSEILRLSMSGEDARSPTMIVNAVTQSYLDEVITNEENLRRSRQKMLKENWNRYQESLRQKRQELKSLAELAGSNDKQTLSSMHQSEQDRLSRAEAELARTQAEMRSLLVEEAVLKRQIALVSESVSTASVDEEVENDPTIAAMAASLEKSRANLARAERVAKDPSDAAVKTRRTEVKTLETALRDRRNQVRQFKKTLLAERGTADLWIKQELIGERVRILKDVEKMFEGDVKRLSERSKTISRTAVDVASIQEEIAAAEEVTKKIASEVEVLNVELQAPSRVRLIEKAEIPRIKDGKQLLKLTAGAGLGALSLVVAGVAYREYQARRIATLEEVSGGLGLRVLATLPDLIIRRTRSSKANELESKSLLIESIDSARTYLLHASQVTSHRVIMICSAVGGEGKTTLACHLATSLARAGRRTLLIDFALRHPSIHQLVDIPAAPGVCEALRGEIAPEAAAVATDTNLWIMPAGRCDNLALQALSRDVSRKFFERLKNQYDFILVDSSPILAVADSILISQHVDASLFSILHTVSQFPKVSAAYERLARLGTPILGAIVTGMHNPLIDNEYTYLNQET